MWSNKPLKLIPYCIPTISDTQLAACLSALGKDPEMMLTNFVAGVISDDAKSSAAVGGDGQNMDWIIQESAMDADGTSEHGEQAEVILMALTKKE